MNERIKQLAEQCGFKSNPDIYDRNQSFDIEKFAKLIIRDCMHDCLRMQLYVQYTPEELLFQTKYRKIIKEHFGVEE